MGLIVNKPVQLPGGSIIAGSSLQDDPGKHIHVERSTDNGQTWSRIGPHSLAEIAQERRAGYRYYGSWARKLLTRDYPQWQSKRQLPKERSPYSCYL